MKKCKGDERLKGKKILVVDDSPQIRELVSAVLTHKGADVIEAENGSNAVARALTEKPDVILMDIHMPNGNGIEASRIIKDSQKKGPFRSRIILSSVDYDLLERASAEPLLIEDSLQKPYSINDLLEKTVKNLSDKDN